MRTVSIPSSPDHVDAAWLSDVLGARVVDVALERIGAGVGILSEIYRATVTTEPLGAGPASVIVKLKTAEDINLLTALVVRAYEKEVGFYREAAHTVPVPVPRCYAAEVVDGTGETVLVLEDLGHLHAADQVAGASPDQARAAVDALARWHAAWWQRTEELAAFSWPIPIDDPLWETLLPDMYEEGWVAALEVFPDLAARLGELGPRVGEQIPRLLRHLGKAPITLLHGDYRLDNLLFDDRGEVTVIDFQIAGVGHGAYDLAYFVEQSLSPAVRRAIEAELIERYRTGLVRGGVPEADLATIDLAYRAAGLFCLTYPVLAARQLETDRAVALERANLERCVALVEDHDLGSVLVDLPA